MVKYKKEINIIIDIFFLIIDHNRALTLVPFLKDPGFLIVKLFLTNDIL